MIPRAGHPYDWYLQAVMRSPKASTPKDLAKAYCLAAKQTKSKTLNLSGLGLDELPQEVWDLHHLRYLNISENHLQRIPQEISKLIDLQFLDISQNWLIELPVELTRLLRLRVLNLEKNPKLCELPSMLHRIGTLHDIAINDTKICPKKRDAILEKNSKDILFRLRLDDYIDDPTVIGPEEDKKRIVDIILHINMKPLGSTWVGLENISLNKYPKEFYDLDYETLTITDSKHLIYQWPDLSRVRAKNLTLELNRCTILPEEIGSMDLHELSIINCPNLTNISVIGQLKNLKNLHIGNCPNIKSLPKDIGKLSKLNELKLVELTNVSTLPKEIGKLVNLKRLSILKTNIESFPKEVDNLKKLEILTLRDNQFSDISIVQNLSLIKLDIQGNKIAECPDWLGILTNLHSLRVAKTQWTKISTEIGNLKKLEILQLQDNPNLTSLPLQISLLEKLEKVDINKNNLKEFPVALCQLPTLKFLDISSNEIGVLPKEIMYLANLEYLNLSNNLITSLPWEFWEMRNLTHLCLMGRENSNTSLTSISSSIRNLRNLLFLDLSNNKNLEHLPLSLGQLSDLTELNVEGTRISDDEQQNILEMAQDANEVYALEQLITRLNHWGFLAGVTDLNDIIESLEDDKKVLLNEWLRRLERTEDFDRVQTSLTKVVCAMIKNVMETPQFAEQFFAQVHANNMCCKDRAAMALNEIYTSWRITTLDRTKPLSEKLQIVTGVAKTCTLRKCIGNLLSKHEPSNKESVEVYLYYETAFRRTLHLDTAVENMAYSETGKRSWVEEQYVTKFVEENVFDTIYEDIPAFMQMFTNDQKNMEKINALSCTFLEELGERPSGSEMSPAILDYQAKGYALKQKMDADKKILAKKWYQENL